MQNDILIVFSLSQSVSRRLKHCHNLRLADCLHCRHLRLANEISIAFSNCGTQLATVLLYWVIHCKGLQSLSQNRDFFPLDQRGAGADALLGAATGVKRNA